MHWEILDAHRQALLEKATLLSGEGFYMAGGTALSLQEGLRESVDFDFFTSAPFNEAALYGRFAEGGFSGVKSRKAEYGTCDMTIEGVQVVFFWYPYALLKPPVLSVRLPRLKMADPYDIAVMKLSAIGARGAKKDFFDLYHILTRYAVSADALLGLAMLKFGPGRDLSYMVAGLRYFDDAEGEQLGRTFVRSDWSEIKQYFEKFGKEALRVLQQMSKEDLLKEAEAVLQKDGSFRSTPQGEVCTEAKRRNTVLER